MGKIKFEADVINGMIKIPKRFKNIESKHLEIIAMIISKNEIEETKVKSYTKEHIEENWEKFVSEALYNYNEDYYKSRHKMEVQAVRMKKGWYIKNLFGFEDVKKDIITLVVDIPEKELSTLDYKELRGIAIMERYNEKRKRETIYRKDMESIQKKFRKEHNIKSDNFIDALKEI